MKLPAITQQPVGEYALGNIATPQVGRRTKAIGALVDAVSDLKSVGDLDESTGKAAQELSELRAQLVGQNTLDAAFVGDDAIGEQQLIVTDGKGGRKEVSKPVIFTHEVANDLWAVRSAEIVDHYANQIKDKDARAKFREEVMTRYVAPGGAAVMGANFTRARAYGQARAEQAIEGVLASNAPTEERETNAREIIARQLLLGADPVWAENQLAAVGPAIDQIDIMNKILIAGSEDEIDQIEEEMYAVGSRMSPEQMRTQSGIMDQRRRDYQAENKARQVGNADQMFSNLHDSRTPPVTVADVTTAVRTDQITREAGQTFMNFLNQGSTTKASSPWTLSRYRGEIQRLQYTGNRMRMSDKAQLLKLMITRGSMGLNPNGTPTGQPATISGEDAFKLNKDIDAAMEAALETESYDNAWAMAKSHTGVTNDIYGQLLGNQDQREAAIAFKEALDNYMDQYGVDAKPIEFFQANKKSYAPENFRRGVNAGFLVQVPQASPYMSQTGTGVDITQEFTAENQDNFLLWLSGAEGSVGAERFDEIWTLYRQYYQGQGIAPNNGELMLEDDDPLYRQFEATIPE
jgi:hypothetical protein